MDKANINDAETLLNLQKRAFAPLYEIYRDERPYLYTIRNMEERITREGADYYKIIADDVLVGGVCVYRKTETEYWLATIYIAPEYQNRHAAQTAIARVEKRYPNAKIWGLDFPVDQAVNRRCYERLGYRDTGKRQKINERLTLAIYEKETNKKESLFL